MALQTAAIANSIAGLSVAGLSIRDVDEKPAGVDARQPTLFPLENYITDFNMVRDSFGGGSTAKMTVTYTLNYRLCYKPIGAGRSNIISWFDDVVDMTMLFIDAVLAVETLTGLIDIIPVEITNMGGVEDPANNIFYGCDIGVNVKEFVN